MIYLPIAFVILGCFALLIGILYQGGFIHQQLFLSSEVKGVLLEHGNPLAGVKVRQTINWSWSDTSYTTEVTTASDGSFSFPEVRKRLFLVLPHQPSVRQDIYVEEPIYALVYGKEFTVDTKTVKENGVSRKMPIRKKVIILWHYIKGDYTNNSELASRKPIDLICDITQEYQAIEKLNANSFKDSPFGVGRLRE